MNLPEGSSPIMNTPDLEDWGMYRIVIGNRYQGKRIRDVHPAELESFIGWTLVNAVRDGTWLYDETLKLAHAVKMYKDQKYQKNMQLIEVPK